MSKKQAIQKLQREIDSRGRERLRSSEEDGKIKYDVDWQRTYSIGNQTVTAQENLKAPAAFNAAMKEAIRLTRFELAKEEEEKQTFAKSVRELLQEDDRIVSGRLSKSLFSTSIYSLTSTEAGDRKALVPYPEQNNKGITEDQRKQKIGDINTAQRLDGKIKSMIGKQAAQFNMRLGVEVNLRALEYYRMLDVGFTPSEAYEWIPKGGREYDRLRKWVQRKLAPSADINKLDNAVYNITEKWKEEGRAGGFYTEQALSLYRKYVEQEVRKKFVEIAFSSGLLKEMSAADANKYAMAALNYNGIFAANVAKSRQAFAGQILWTKQSATLVVAEIADVEGSKERAKQEQKKAKELLEEAKKKAARAADDVDDPYGDIIGLPTDDELREIEEGYTK